MAAQPKVVPVEYKLPSGQVTAQGYEVVVGDGALVELGGGRLGVVEPRQATTYRTQVGAQIARERYLGLSGVGTYAELSERSTRALVDRMEDTGRAPWQFAEERERLRVILSERDDAAEVLRAQGVALSLPAEAR
jgi:hypothetical protein